MSSEMKESNFEWIGKIPDKWHMVPHKYIFNYEKGKKVDFLNSKTKYSLPYITMEVYRGESKPNYATRESGILVDPDDICILWDGSNAGEVYKPNMEGILSSTSAKLNVISKNINKKYLYYYLKAYETTLKDKTIGMGIPHVDGNKLLNDKIPLPEIEEQENISNYLESSSLLIDESISLSRKSIQEFKTFKRSLITETVTKGLDSNVPMKDSGIDGIGFYPNNWALTKLKYLISLDPSFKDEESNPEYSTFVPMDHLKQGYFINGNMVKTKDVANSYSFFAEGDIAIAKVRPSFENGNIALMNNLKTGIGFGTSEIFVLRIESNRIINKYLLYYLMNENFINITSSTMTGVAGLKRYSSSFLMNYPIPLPPLNEQKEIIDYLDKKTAQIDQLIEDKTKLIEELENYKQSLIYEYVTGKKEV